MQAYEIQSFSTGGLARVERPEPEPGPGQVRLRVRAASLNYRDLLMVEGRYDPRQRLPLIPLSDGAGVVEAVGEGVTRFSVGDRAAAIFAQRWLSGEPTREELRSTLGGPLDGVLAEQVVLHEDGLVAVPPGLGDEEAASLPCAGVTAWSALVDYGRVGAGDTVLVLGTGGVSLFALQLARLRGARAIVTSGSDDKRARARELGAWETIDYRSEPRWGDRVRELTGGRGVDLVVEVGGAGTLAQSLRAVRFGGRIALIGVLAGHDHQVDLRPIVMRRVSLEGILVGPRQSFEALNRAVEQGGLRPAIDRVFPFRDAPEAFRHLAAARHFGKVCIRL